MGKFMNMSDLLILVLAAIGLLILDRIYRINVVIEKDTKFQQCGVNMPPCPFGTKCMNGYCGNNDVPVLKPTMLPVFP